MKPKVKVRSGLRPATSIDRLSSTHAKEDGARFLSVPLHKIDINPDNVRDTFKTFKALEEFTKSIRWPENALDGGLDDPLEWLDEIEGADQQALERFKRVVEMALSIKELGQLQPAGAVSDGDRYRIVLGSTRAMGCWLLQRDVEISLIPARTDSATELMAHLAENLKRDDLSFTETASGYYTLFDLLINSGSIESITRKEVMVRLSLSRTHALRWRSVLLKAQEDIEFRSMLLNGELNSLTEAYAATRSEEPPGTKEIVQSVHTGKTDKHRPINSNEDSKRLPAKPKQDGESDKRGNPEADSSFDPEKARKLLHLIFETAINHHQQQKPHIAEQIRNHLTTHCSAIQSKADALRHFAWLTDTVAVK